MKENAFSKEMVITEKWAFKATICGELRAKTRGFSVSARKNNLPYSRIGMCISRKSIRSSVNRNTVKRKIREDFRTFASKEIAGFDIVIRVLKFPKGDFVELDKLWSKLKVSCFPQ